MSEPHCIDVYEESVIITKRIQAFYCDRLIAFPDYDRTFPKAHRGVPSSR